MLYPWDSNYWKKKYERVRMVDNEPYDLKEIWTFCFTPQFAKVF
jgi:hypothetical protein